MAAEPWESCYGLSSTFSFVVFSDRNRSFLCPNWRVVRSDRCFSANRGIFVAFCADFRADASRLCWVVLVVVFHTGLRQPWRASIFRVLLASVAPAVTVEEDSKGLQSFRIKALFGKFRLRYCIYGSYFPYGKFCCRQRQSNNSFIGYDLSLPLNWYVYMV